MSKQPMEWHLEGIRNNRRFVADMRKHLEHEQQRLKRAEEDLALREAQYAEAARRGLDGFDGERFMIQKRKKTA